MKHEPSQAEKLDVEIGARIRHIRKLRGLTQTQLGESLGVTFQQVQKYERGMNRVSTSALILLGRALDVSPGVLLGLEGEGPGREVDFSLLSEDGAYELLHAVSQIVSREHRLVVVELAKDLAGVGGPEPTARA